MDTPVAFKSRDYWIVENTNYIAPSFRLRKCAKMVNKIAGGRACDLLDVGCGPAALQSLLEPNITYYGLDIAIHNPAPNLREIDTSITPIGFDGRRFDIITALGFFEYMGSAQNKKFQEIRDILKDDGTFILTYINFDHMRKQVWPNYNNVQSVADMDKALSEVFCVRRCFPASHHWRQKQPGKFSLQSLQMKINSSIPFITPLFAVEYFFICSHKK